MGQNSPTRLIEYYIYYIIIPALQAIVETKSLDTNIQYFGQPSTPHVRTNLSWSNKSLHPGNPLHHARCVQLSPLLHRARCKLHVCQGNPGLETEVVCVGICPFGGVGNSGDVTAGRTRGVEKRLVGEVEV